MDFLEISQIVLSVYAIAEIIVRLTPTKKDDEVLSVVGKIILTIFKKGRYK
jgi:hypothetical protein